MSFSFAEYARSLLVEFKLPKHVEVSENDLDTLRSLDWTEIDWEEGGEENGVIYLLPILPAEVQHLAEGIAVHIQVLQDTFYQVHIALYENLRGLKLAVKIYRSLIEWAGQIYSGKGRRQSDAIPAVWKKLKSMQGVYCLDNSLADMCIDSKLLGTREVQNVISKFNMLGKSEM